MYVRQNNQFAPIMYMIKRFAKRQYNKAQAGYDLEGLDMMEGITLHRDAQMRLEQVEGDEVIDTDLVYLTNGMLDYVIVTNKVTQAQLQVNLIYENNLLVRVEPSVINEGSGITYSDSYDLFN